MRLVQEGADSLDRSGARLAAPAQVEYESRVADGLPTKTGRSRVAAAKKLFYLSKQGHCSILSYRATRLLIVSQRNSYLSRYLPMFMERKMEGAR